MKMAMRSDTRRRRLVRHNTVTQSEALVRGNRVIASKKRT